MLSPLQPPLMARNGRQLQVLGIARISTEHQDALSLEDQEALYRQWLTRHTDLPYHLRMISGRGSGELLDRQEAKQAEAEVATAGYDLVIAEDLGRIFRRIHAFLFCEVCEDIGTRLVAINDHVDTGRDDWRLHAFFASIRQEMYNADTAKRIRRSLRNRFLQGGVVQTVVYGYRKPVGAKTDTELQKDPQAEPVYEEMFRQLEDGASYAEVADWLNARGIKPGPYVRSSHWTCSMVTRLIHNPILKGVRVRNKKLSKRVNQTGHRKAVPAPPSERLERLCPHLAFIQPARYDRLLGMLDARNAKYRRRGVNGVDTRKNVPKKRTIWPGQHIYCGVCGRLYVYGGHGQQDHLLCRGAHDYRCWNAITVDAPLAAQHMIAAIGREIAALPDFDPVLLQLVQEELRQGQDAQGRQQQEGMRRRAATERELQNILAALREAGPSPSLLAELARLEQEKTQQSWEQEEFERHSSHPLLVPDLAEIKARAFAAFDTLARTSSEFGRLLRRLIPRILVWPYRLCDGGHPVLRAQFTFSLVSLVPAVPGRERLTGALQRSMMVDLFEEPQRVAYRSPVLELTGNGLEQREIAWELDLTQPAVQRSVGLSRRMAALGISDPYQPLMAPPDDYERLRRHKHARYRFEPLPGERPWPPPVRS
jgi:DNA invertase Pin-like site-specific DNA recombinase